MMSVNGASNLAIISSNGSTADANATPTNLYAPSEMSDSIVASAAGSTVMNGLGSKTNPIRQQQFLALASNRLPNHWQHQHGNNSAAVMAANANVVGNPSKNGISNDKNNPPRQEASLKQLLSAWF
jgi:hypothetical protein